MKANYLVCYDITEPRRLSRVYKFIKGMGLHIQYSVFSISLFFDMAKIAGTQREAEPLD
jgi:CRISPR-associated endonuclease Cas2